MDVGREKEIIKKVLDGDGNAFEELVIANEKNVYNLALKMTKNEEDASDITQEAFIKAYRQLGAFRGDSKFSVWLYRMTYNLCIDFLRKNSKTRVISISSYQDDTGDAVDIEFPDIRALPTEVVEQKELRELIAKSINELNDDHRQILIMRELEDMSYCDIADVLNISEGTVKSRIARARQNLVKILSERGTFPESSRHKNTS